MMMAGAMAAPAVLCASAQSNDTGTCLGQLVCGTLPVIKMYKHMQEMFHQLKH